MSCIYNVQSHTKVLRDREVSGVPVDTLKYSSKVRSTGKFQRLVEGVWCKQITAWLQYTAKSAHITTDHKNYPPQLAVCTLLQRSIKFTSLRWEGGEQCHTTHTNTHTNTDLTQRPWYLQSTTSLLVTHITSNSYGKAPQHGLKSTTACCIM